MKVQNELQGVCLCKESNRDPWQNVPDFPFAG